MHLTNLHTHTTYCDGKNTAEDMIISAINNNFKSIGISSHGPVSFDTDWHMSHNKIKKYIDEIRYLKEKYKGCIDVFLGMELDYIPGMGFDETTKELIKELDYYIGSVHYLGTLKNGYRWTVDYTLEEIKEGIKDTYGGNIQRAVELYYDLISEMALEYEPPIIGHLDLIKKNNKDNVIFDEKEDWYIKAVENCLDSIKKTSSIIEINTGGIAKGYISEQYPSTFIIEMIKEKNIPIIINSDVHDKNDILCSFEEMYKLIYDLKFESTSYLSKKGWAKNIVNKTVEI